jgi:hypothetical protein
MWLVVAEVGRAACFRRVRVEVVLLLEEVEVVVLVVEWMRTKGDWGGGGG